MRTVSLTARTLPEDRSEQPIILTKNCFLMYRLAFEWVFNQRKIVVVILYDIYMIFDQVVFIDQFIRYFYYLPCLIMMWIGINCFRNVSVSWHVSVNCL